ncbi:MAG: ketoacid-CoA transferase [Deltaproteobacteria bacterium]|nr:MAG: ketoacid-CoA transferase [Deltaproteobacteria bacterium]
MREATSRERMVLAAARRIKDEEIVFCGTGISMIAAMAAKRIHAPNSIIFFETGAIDSQLFELPLSVGDPRIMTRASINAGFVASFSILQNPETGSCSVAILGAAQIDPYGNLNSTCIGSYLRPETRFPGSGGASDAAVYAARTMIFMKLEKRKFVEKLDYLTSPGWKPGGKNGAQAHGKPDVVITDKGTFMFDEGTHRMYLSTCFPGVAPEFIRENVGFEIDIGRAVEEVEPSEESLNLLRNHIDPQHLIL